MKAKLMKVLKWRAKAEWYRLDEPLHGCLDVVVSSRELAADRGLPETLIFPANEHGEPTSFGELPGSNYGSADGEAVLFSLGYEIER